MEHAAAGISAAGSTLGRLPARNRAILQPDRQKETRPPVTGSGRGRGRYEPGIGRVQAINARMLPDDYLLSSSVRVIMDDFKDTPTRQASQPIFSNLDFPRSGRV